MSRFFPHTEYAEEQPLAHTILTIHVLHRGFQSGAALGLTTGAASYLYRLSQSEVPLRAALGSGHFASTLKGAVHPKFSQTLFKHAGVGALAGVSMMTVGLVSMMKGKQEIEWQDRAWRLQQNQGQLEVDDWSLGGASAGFVSSFLGSGKDGLKQIVGRTAVGSILGVVGYLGYRYGIKKGKRMEELKGAARIPEISTV